ncbi:hypothetical protein TSOC_011526 [Tetrabaena socialis]|uniref:Uncharacterized protein n=1 Tax=Tetrabaena socialis TaxID=47790 RepID=A0A2J7ZQF6_9CHLO|nr:hypothetical protein TSOC_011526 [Tetrabaena socialis]|eukprot:PNH02490.1 hypothetical protein TSOC_011526 [Tetrabaena socialis]
MEPGLKAEAGHLDVVVWLEATGVAEVLTLDVYESATESGSMELLAWLHARVRLPQAQARAGGGHCGVGQLDAAGLAAGAQLPDGGR